MSRNLSLKIAFLQAGRSQKAVADEIGIHDSHLSRIVNGLSCNHETKVAIAAALGRPVGELWPGQGAESDQTDSGLNSTRLEAA